MLRLVIFLPGNTPEETRGGKKKKKKKMARAHTFFGREFVIKTDRLRFLSFFFFFFEKVPTVPHKSADLCNPFRVTFYSQTFFLSLFLLDMMTAGKARRVGYAE